MIVTVCPRCKRLYDGAGPCPYCGPGEDDPVADRWYFWAGVALLNGLLVIVLWMLLS